MNEVAIQQSLLEAIQKTSGELDPQLAKQLLEPGFDMSLADFGLDSLEAIQCCMEIESLTGVELDPAELVTTDTFAALANLVADRLQGGTRRGTPQMVRASRDAPLRLTYSQEAIWPYCQPPNIGYVLHIVDRITGPLDVAIFRDCLTQFVRRHEIARSTFADADGEPRQIVHPSEPVSLPVFELKTTVEPNEQLIEIIEAEKVRVSDMSQPPLIRFSLLRGSPDEHWLVVVCHHLIWDGWSTDLFHDEIALLYEAKHSGNEPPLPEEDWLQYADYATWQREMLRHDGSAYRRIIGWWKQHFARELPWYDLPFSRATPSSAAKPDDGVIELTVPSLLRSGVESLQRSENITFYNIWMASFVALLSSMTGRSDVVVGTYAANRNHAATQKMIGFLVNLIALRFHCKQSTSFANWLREVKAATAAAIPNGEIPIEQLLREGIAIPPIQAVFNAPLNLGRLGFSTANLNISKPHHRIQSQMPSGFEIVLLDQNAALICRVSFDATIYDPVTVRKFGNRLFDFISRATQAPEKSLSQLLDEAVN